MSTLLFYSQKKSVTRENESSERFSQPAQDDTEEGIELSPELGLLTPGPQLLFHWAPQPPQESVGTEGFSPGQRRAHVAREPLPCPASLPVLLSEGRVLCSPAEDTVPGVNIHTLMGGWG